MKKVWMYIDGFNFYYGVRDLRREFGHPIGLGWCDFRRLAEQHMIDNDAELVRIKYFTSEVGIFGHGDGEEERRQDRWLKAVMTIKGLEVIKGYYTQREGRSREEKQTDVNLAIELVVDAMRPNGYDEAILVSEDTDLVPAVLAVRRRLPGQKSVHVWTSLSKPPRRWNDLVRSEGVICRQINPEMLADSRLPDRIPSINGPIYCLPEWRMPESARKGGEASK